MNAERTARIAFRSIKLFLALTGAVCALVLAVSGSPVWGLVVVWYTEWGIHDCGDQPEQIEKIFAETSWEDEASPGLVVCDDDGKLFVIHSSLENRKEYQDSKTATARKINAGIYKYYRTAKDAVFGEVYSNLATAEKDLAICKYILHILIQRT